MRRAFQIVIALLLLIVLVGLVGYWSLPQWLPSWIRAQLPPGFELTELQLQRPGTESALVSELVGTYEHYRVHLKDARLQWDFSSLRQGRVNRIEVARLEVTVGESKTESDIPSPPELKTLWAAIPTDFLNIRELTVSITKTQLLAAGSAEFDPAKLDIQLKASAPDNLQGYEMRGRLERGGALAANVAAPGKPSQLKLRSGWPDAAHWSVAFDIALKDDVLNAITPNFGLNSERVDLQFSGRLSGAWPPSITTTQQAEGRFHLVWQGNFSPYISAATLDLTGSLARDNQGIRLLLEPFSAQRILLQSSEPWLLLEQEIPLALRLSSARPSNAHWFAESFTLDSGLVIHIGDDASSALVELDALHGRFTENPLRIVNLQAPLRLQAQVRRDVGDFQAQAQANLFWQDHLQMELTKLQIDARNLQGYGIDHLQMFANDVIKAQLNLQPLAFAAQPLSLGVQMPEYPLVALGGSVKVDRADVQTLAYTGETGLTTELTLTGLLARAPLQIPFVSHQSIVLLDSKVQATLDAVPNEAAFKVNGTFAHDLSSRNGQLNYELDWQYSRPWLGVLSPGWKEVFDIDKGTLRSKGQFTWRPPRRTGGEWHIKGAGDFSSENLAGHYDDSLAKGIKARGQWQLSEAGMALKAVRLQIAEMAIGTAITDVKTTLNYGKGQLAVAEVAAAALGGDIVIAPFTYHVGDGSAQMQIILNNLDLAAVLALEGEHVRGNGILDGELPLTLANNTPTIQQGRLSARPPGGLIQYFDAPSLATYARDQGFEFALAALGDYRFTKLDALVEYAPDHSMKLGLRLEGRNPAVEAGRPIHYNLNITENLADLLRSLRLANRVTDEVERRVNES